MYTEAIDWTTDGRVRLLDQTRLPSAEVFLEIDAIPDMVEAIHALRVRGAPLIGVAAAMGLAASALRQFGNGHPRTRAEVEEWVLRAGG